MYHVVMKNNLRIASLNLWRFNDWEKRKSLIASVLKDKNYDVIFFQEVQKDLSSLSNLNQIDILNKEINYPYIDFSEAMIKTMSKGIPLLTPISHGIGLMSKFPILNKSIIRMSKFPEDTDKRISVIYDIEIDGNVISFINIHFSNRDDWAEAHLKELLTQLDSTKEYIIIGDFNIFHLEKYESLYINKYKNSFSFKNYISFPKENATFDYVLIPKDYNFVDIETTDGLSDHSMIIVEITK